MLRKIRQRLRPLFILWTIAMWCLLMGEVTWANLLAGLGVGVLVAVALPLPAMPIAGIKVHWGLLLAFIAEWLWDLLVASVKVAWLAVRRQDPPRTAIVTLPMRVANELVLYFACVSYNLQPGGTITDIDIANRTLTIHLLDADDDVDLQREANNVAELERRMIRIFERV
ncbi:Na+/H+ antiporter subunit E [Corynebacterium uterequi]|uniref:Multisubunit sodium/proton antiporter, MrpE subunit n=1 Tax=Corynebacterium uterequi TaxID=1072256 RepID=A0A0G3HIX8_9CORY|nr:Na+/H+ antiporter subunit E [Corynebacterium uterequi]AKK11898.1 multisubunit sodium/proton antiporter, MrpE subunit [Corynebacterium uterequi]